MEEANNLVIQFKESEKKIYDIGKIIFKNNKDYIDKHIQPKGNYTVGYSDFSLDANLISDRNLSIKKVDDLTSLFFYEFDEQVKMTKDVPEHLNILSFKAGKEDFDFYTVTPILHYEINGKEYLYNMPSVLYGIMDSEIDLIKKIIDEKI